MLRWSSTCEKIQRPPLWFTALWCVGILIARRPDAWRTPQFWAEDGTVFFAQAWSLGARAVVQPYAGYLHVLPRTVAWFAVQFDPLWSPLIFQIGAAGFTLYVALRTQSSRMPWGPHVGFALAVVLVPDVFEVLLFLVNSQWVLAGGLLLLLIARDAQNRAQRVHDAVAAVLLGLTGPFSVALSPLCVWRAALRRTRASMLVAAVVLATAAVQAWFIIRADAATSEKSVATEALLAVPGMRVAASLFGGKFVPPDYDLGAETALGIGALGLVALLALRRGEARFERAWLALAFAVLLACTLYRCRFVLLDLRHATYGSRYFFPLQLAVLWLLLAAAQDSRRWPGNAARAALLWILVVNLPRLQEPGLTDLHWAQQAARLRAGTAIDVPINPAGWSFSVLA